MNRKENVCDLNIVGHICNETENCSISTSRTIIHVFIISMSYASVFSHPRTFHT